MPKLHVLIAALLRSPPTKQDLDHMTFHRLNQAIFGYLALHCIVACFFVLSAHRHRRLTAWVGNGEFLFRTKDTDCQDSIGQTSFNFTQTAVLVDFRHHLTLSSSLKQFLWSLVYHHNAVTPSL